MASQAAPRSALSSAVPRRLRPAARRVRTLYQSRGLGPHDIVLASYPKAGSTWMRFVLALALSGQDVDFDAVPSVSPPLGKQRTGPLIVPGGGRLVKSHELPGFFARPGRHPRVLCMVRDGRDIAVSYYYHLLRTGRIAEGFDQYFDAFLEGRVGGVGSWQGHCRAWLDYSAGRTSTHFLKYEDLLVAPEQQLAAVSEHFALNLDADVIADALRRNTPEGIREKEATSTRVRANAVVGGIPFVRTPRAGQWHTVLTTEHVARFVAVAGTELSALGYPTYA